MSTEPMRSMGQLWRKVKGIMSEDTTTMKTEPPSVSVRSARAYAWASGSIFTSGALRLDAIA